jgi:hypothetical protein
LTRALTKCGRIGLSGICSLRDAIVIADLPLLLDAQDLIEIDAWNGREGRALAGRIDGEAGVVGGQIDLTDESAGRLDVGDASETKLLRQPVLKRPERPLRSASGEGRPEGRPSLDGLW